MEVSVAPSPTPPPPPWKTATSTGPPLSLLSFLSRYSYYPRFFVFTMSTTIFQLILLHFLVFLLTTTLTDSLRLPHDNIYITNKNYYETIYNYTQHRLHYDTIIIIYLCIQHYLRQNIIIYELDTISLR